MSRSCSWLNTVVPLLKLFVLHVYLYVPSQYGYCNSYVNDTPEGRSTHKLPSYKEVVQSFLLLRSLHLVHPTFLGPPPPVLSQLLQGFPLLHQLPRFLTQFLFCRWVRKEVALLVSTQSIPRSILVVAL